MTPHSRLYANICIRPIVQCWFTPFKRWIARKCVATASFKRKNTSIAQMKRQQRRGAESFWRKWGNTLVVRHALNQLWPIEWHATSFLIQTSWQFLMF